MFARRRSVFDDQPDSMVHICRVRGVRLTAARIQIACIFDDTDEPLDRPGVWARAQAKGIQIERSSVYRLLRDMKLCGAVTTVETTDQRELFRKARPARGIELLNLANKARTQVPDEGLLEQIERLVASYGFQLTGQVVVTVAPRHSA